MKARDDPGAQQGNESHAMNIPTAISRTEPGSAGAVKAVSVISTGTVQIRPEHPYGSRSPMYWWLLTSRQWTPPRPVNVYVIEHARGLILFDTGQDRASVTDDHYFPGGLAGYLYGRLARFDIGERDTLSAQLATLGYAPSDVGTAILSHLHQDHIGGLPELASADVLVSASEWAELSRPAPELRGFLRSHIQLPSLHWRQVTMEPADDAGLEPFTESLDLMGDGSLVLLPTPGHTAGSVSLLVRRDHRPPLLLAGDLTYGADILHRGQLPGVGRRRQLAESTGKVRALAERQPGLIVLPAHDPTAARRLLDS
jgi:glyoxylase-like metal-dependent hydrolase (beta-lactamase superfamily II)